MNDQTNPILNRFLSFLRTSPIMARGKITTEFRQGPPGADGKPVVLGPYHKIQGREHGDHFTGRIPASQLDCVKAQIANLEQFRTLSEAFVDEAVAAGKVEAAQASHDSMEKKLRRSLSP
jgi:hypothetical protein